MANITFGSNWQPYTIADLSGGLNIDTSKVNPNELLVCENIDLQTYGAVTKRGGYRDCNATARTVTSGNGGIRTLFAYSKNTSGVFSETVLGANDGKIFKGVAGTVPANKLVFSSFTDLTTGLTAGDKFYMAALVNRAMISSIHHRLWTDGTTVYNNGVAAPAAPSTNVIAAGGALTIGTYKVAYAYKMSGNNYYETNVGATATVSIAVNNSYVEVTVAASADPQIDKIRIFITSPGGEVLYYQTEVANANATIDIGLTTTLAGEVAVLDNFVPPKAKYILSVGNRIFYANTDDAKNGTSLVRWSHLNDPHSVGEANWAEFSPEDGTEITGIGAVLNYLVVFKRNSIFTLDLGDFSKAQISHKDGAICDGSIQTLYNGKSVAFLSESGVKVFDGQNVISISDLKVNTIVCHNIDMDDVADKTVSLYYPTGRKYSLVLPVASGSYVWLNYYFDEYGKMSSWSQYLMFSPTAMCLAADDDGNIVPLAAHYSGTSAYISETDYRRSNTDGCYFDPTAAPGSEITPGATVQMKFKTVPHNFGAAGATKQVRRCDLEWMSASPTEAQFEVAVDFGTHTGIIKKVSHDGATFWGGFYWGHGYWGQSGRAVDRIDLRGKGQNYEFIFLENSDSIVTVYGMNFLFYPVSYQGVTDAQ